MITVNDIIKTIETLAPKHYAESWDNVGLMVGTVGGIVNKVITTLDITPEVIDFAIHEKAQLIISHHPFIFKGLKSINLDSAQGSMIERLIKHDIAVYSAHTNLDIADGGLNDMLARRLGLQDIRGFVPLGSDMMYKITTFVPESSADAVRSAMAEAGAGRIGNYDCCSFSYVGEGRFKGNANANPTIGNIGALEVVQEVAVQVIVEEKMLSQVLMAMKEVHPYEEVAYDVVALAEPRCGRTLGRVGILPEAMDVDVFCDYVQECLPHSQLRFGGVKKELIKTIALCSGAGASFLKQATVADAYITGDVKYHDAQLAKELGVFIVDAGHFGTEEIVADGLAQYLLEQAELQAWNIQILPFHEQEDFFFTVP